MAWFALILTTAGESFSAIEANALPVWRRMSMLFGSSASADNGEISEKTMRTKLMRDSVLCLDGLTMVVIFLVSK
jgi:hypothetical protein